MKRLRLAQKMALAIIPIGLVALAAGGFVAWTFLERSNSQEEAAGAAIVSVEAMSTLRNVWSEEQAVALGTVSMGPVHGGVDTAFARLRTAAANLDGGSSPGSEVAATIAEVEAKLAAARAGGTVAGYEEINNLLVSIVAQSSFFIADREPAREMSAAAALAEAARISFRQEQLRRSVPDPNEVREPIELLEVTFSSWIERALTSSASAQAALDVPNVAATPQPVDLGQFPVDRDQLVLDVAQDLAGAVSSAGIAQADRSRLEAVVIGGGVAVILLVTGWAALVIGRSLVRRIRMVTDVARRVAEVDLPNLVDALRNPRESLETPEPVDLAGSGSDEVGELAHSFSALHGTLVDVAREQMNILRRGVSEIFVTLARRNRILVDRQLALIDQLEAREEEPEVLGGYYKLDHLATRMRRNAESLLVLAGTDPPRVWAKPVDMNDVIRAALGEVEDYQRIDVLAVEPARLAGSVVTDLAHLMSELLDNATQYSPPTDRVRITGLFDQDGYVVTIADRGMGISESRRAELNGLLELPPVLGLALDPTLGLYVVARLAARHGISVRLVAGVPGTTARITVPRSLLDTTPEDESPSSDRDALEAPWKDGDITAHAANGAGVASGHNGAEAVNGGLVRRTTSPSAESATAARKPDPPTPGEPTARPSTAAEPARSATPPAPVASRPVFNMIPAAPSTAPQDAPRPAPAPSPSPEVKVTNPGLPVRTPGAAFNEQLSATESTATSAIGAEGIRSALSAFRSGQESAGGHGPEGELEGGSE